MNYFVYVLLNYNKEHWYVGSSNNIDKRLLSHNLGYTISTKPYKPWQIVYFEKFNTRSEAFKREMYLKSPMGYNDYLQIKRKVLDCHIGGVA